MKEIFSILILCFLSLNIFGQDLEYSDQEIQIKLDSIKKEGNLLYSLENASWNSTDYARDNKKIKKDFGGYLTYQSNDSIKTVILNKTQNEVIAEYIYLNDNKKPIKEKIASRILNDSESKLLSVRQNLFSQLSDAKYEVGVPENFSLNLITIPFGNSFKNYLITGSHESGVIPFGNDFLFITDNEGKIIDWKKFHSRLIPQYTSDGNGNYMTMSTHSHLRTSSFISATDICTFKLYAPFTKLDKFSVYSPALKTYFTYDYKKNTLQKTDKP